ncbi:MAG: hypothetical protein LQ338_001942 [Usnochroma carphineum]|nr:MAG: hypothetical protein LQ338_001942 [Usnochroma carphineum]
MVPTPYPLARPFKSAIATPRSTDSHTNEGSHVPGWFSYAPFRKDCLDRKLESHHITGIAFSGAVGIGIFCTSGEIIALGGPVGALLASIFAGLVVFSVMRCLAEMVSTTKTTIPEGADSHRLANCMSMVTLTMAAAMFTQYWQSSFGMTAATFVLLLAMFFMNACGVQLYGRMEWVFKWLKIALLLGLCILMILIKAGVGPGYVDSSELRLPELSKRPTDPLDFEIGPGYSPKAFLAIAKKAAISGTGGRILAVWTCTTMAMFQFMGGEMVLATAGEARKPMRDLPIAARYMYLLPVSFYLVAILLVGLNVNYLDPRIYHSHVSYYLDSRLQSYQTAARSPFVIAIENAGIKALPGFLDACFLFSALTAANSALYVSSRTLFTLGQRSAISTVRSTIGRTNNGHTPLAAILVSFLPGALAFLAVRSEEKAFREPIHVFGRLYTGPVLCIYAAECLAFLRFLKAIKRWKRTIDRDTDEYRNKHYRAHWQPLWAILGLVLCTLIMLFSGWTAIYDLCAKSPGVDRRDALVDLVAAYIGPLLFFTILVSYKLVKRTTIRSIGDMSNVWFVRDVDEESNIPKGKKRNRFREFLSWVK